MSEDLRETDWNKIKNNDIDLYANNLTEHITKLASIHIPNKIIKIRKSDPSWLTNHIKRLIRKKKKRLYDKFKKTNNKTDFDNYKHIRNQVTNEIRKSKTAEIENLSDKLKDSNISQSSWWKTLKYFIKPDQTSTIPPLNREGVIYCNDFEKSNILNTYFIEQTIVDEDKATLPQTIPLPNYKLDSISVTPDKVQSTLQTLQLGKSAGPDSINNRLLKELAQPLSFPLSDIFNYSLFTGKLPSIWKLANVTPIYKKDDPSDVSNYRPISLLSTIGKVLEKIVHKYVFNFFRDNEVITTLQSGFIPGDSTVNQLVDVYNTFCKALDEGKEVRAIFCDISKAFDRVWHSLLFKLQSVGISGMLLQWFTDYLHNRKQRVVLPGANSDWTSVNSGVPQGSILGPCFFFYILMIL